MSEPRVTPAGVQIPSEPSAPIILEFDTHALRVALVSRGDVSALPVEAWNQPGVYILLGPLGGDGKTALYVGKATELRKRLTHHHRVPKLSWWRAVAVTRDTTNGFNSAEIGYLEGRLSRQLAALPAVSLVAGREDIDQTLPDHLLLSLDDFVPTILAALRLVGIDIARPAVHDGEQPKRRRTVVSGTMAELVAAGLIRPGEKLVFNERGKSAEATVNASGEILMGGVTYGTPSAAGREALEGKAVNGWTAWRVGGSGPTLSVLRERLGEKGASE